MKFKKGDIVELVKYTEPYFLKAKFGAKALVLEDVDSEDPKAEYNDGYLIVKLKWLRDDLSQGQFDGGYIAENYKKLEDKYSKYIKEFFKQGAISKLDYLASLAKDKSDE